MRKTLTRRSLAKLLAGAVAAPFILRSRARASGIAMLSGVHPVQEIEPHRLDFGAVTTLSYFDPQPAGLITLDEEFTADTGQFTEAGAAWPTNASLTIGSGIGAATVTTAGANSGFYAMENLGSIPGPQAFVGVTVASVTGGGAAGGATRVVLAATDLSSFLEWNYNAVANQLNLFLKVSGVAHTVATLSSISLTPPYRLGLSVVGNSVCGWYATSAAGAWQFGAGANVKSLLDLTIPSNTSGLRDGIGAFLNSGGTTFTANFQSLKIGRFGGVGLRDIRIVKDQNGQTYVDGSGNVYFIATASDALATPSCCVYQFNPTTNAITQTGVILGNRDGHNYIDIAGALIRYSSTHYKVFLSSWGTGAPTSVLYGDITGVDLLTGYNAPAIAALTLPPANASYTSWYDPDFIEDGAGGYYLAYVNAIAFNTFVPCLAHSTDLVTWTLVGADTSVSLYEGTQIVRANHKFWVMSGGHPGGVPSSADIRIYDITMSFVGNLSATVTVGPANANPPWPVLFNYTDNRQRMLTFNGTLYNGISLTMGQPTIQSAPRYQ